MKKIKVRTPEPIGRNALARPKSRNCTLGISLGKVHFSKENVEHYMRFGLQYFDKMLIWVADYPERWNYSALRNIPIDEAERLALHQGAQEVSKFKKVVNKITAEDKSARGRIQVADFLSLTKNNSVYDKVLFAVNQEYDENFLFKKDMLCWFHHNMKSRFKAARKKDNLEKSVQIPIKYLKEETAMMLYLAEKHPEQFVDIYPISYLNMYAMKGINENRYPNLWQRLNLKEGYGFIDVRVQEPLSERLGSWIGNKIGRTPEQRRAYRESAISILDITGKTAIIPLALSLIFGPVVAFEYTTLKKEELIEFSGQKYLIKHRKNGAVEMISYPDLLNTYYDRDCNGILDSGIIHARFPCPSDELKRKNEIYRRIVQSSNLDRGENNG